MFNFCCPEAVNCLLSYNQENILKFLKMEITLENKEKLKNVSEVSNNFKKFLNSIVFTIIIFYLKYFKKAVQKTSFNHLEKIFKNVNF